MDAIRKKSAAHPIDSQLLRKDGVGPERLSGHGGHGGHVMRSGAPLAASSLSKTAARPGPSLPDIDLMAWGPKLEAIFAEVAALVPGFPSSIVANEQSDSPSFISRESFEDKTYSYVVFGIEDEAKSAAMQLIKAKVKDAGIPLNVLDGGGVISMSHANAHKGWAVRNFAARLGLDPEEVTKFGDKAGSTGNDRQLLTDANSFDVGEDDDPLPAVVHVGTLAAAGVLEVIARFQADGRPLLAIASDFDGTLTGDGSDGELLDAALAEKLKQLLESGLPIAVITGRGRSIFDVLVRPLRDIGTSDAALQNLTVYMYNGGRGATADALIPQRQGPQRRW